MESKSFEIQELCSDESSNSNDSDPFVLIDARGPRLVGTIPVASKSRTQTATGAPPADRHRKQPLGTLLTRGLLKNGNGLGTQ